MDTIYITPLTRIHSTFADAKAFFDDGGSSFFEEPKASTLNNLVQGRRNLIVGEPGVGKSVLLTKIEDHLKAQGVATALIGLRQTNAVARIDEFLTTDSKDPKALLLDALDEVRSSSFPEMLQKIEDISARNPDLAIFISGRWVFVRRHANSFPEYRFITIPPFRQKQVRNYLTLCGYAERDIDQLLTRIMPYGHRQLVVQIPRYLVYLHKYIQENGLQAASEVSRNDLFEYFIYNKLSLEEKKLNATKKAIIKRVLENLALTMEIYQTNVISEDELMTFFDDTKSELSRAALADTEVFYEYSLLKVSEEDLGKVEFENTEFQEYLAAKEITRLKDVVRSTFAFAVDSKIKEIYPSWYNALTFLVDMQSELLEPLVEFSGLRADKFKVMDEFFLTFLSRIDPRVIAPDLRRQIFKDVIAYHERTLQWLPGELAQSMSGFFETSLESYLKERIAEAEAGSGTKRFVILGNLVYIAAYLLENVTALDRAYWRSKLLDCVRDENDNGVLQRRALLALQLLGDPSVIDELPDLSDADPLIMRHFLSALTALAPDHPKSIDYAITVTKRNDIHGRYTFYAMKEVQAIKRFLRALVDDAEFLREFMDDTTIFRDQDIVLVDNIARVLDDEMREVIKDMLARSTNYNVTHHAEHSTFLSGLWKLLRKGDPTFVTDMIKRIRKGKDQHIHSVNGFLAEIVEKEDVESLIKAMIAAGETWVAREVMARIKQSDRPDAEEIYEAGRPFLSEGYKELEEAQSRSQGIALETKRAQETMQTFRFHLEPTPGQYNSNLFEFFNSHVKEIEPLLTTADRQRMESLLTGTIFKFYDPGKYDLTIDAQLGGRKTYTTDQSVRTFGDAIQAAKHLGIDTAPYRQMIINLIPFAYNDDLNAIFDLKDVTPSEMAPVIEVYRSRKSDLWRHNPESFVQAVERYHVAAAVPVLREFILQPDWEMYVRRQAIPIVESVDPNAEFLCKIFERFRGSHSVDELGLAEIANGLLITNHNDPDAVHWRLREVVQRAAAFVRPRSGHVHAVGELEDEITSGKKFAKPLMELKHTGFENDYLTVLDDAMAIWDRGSDYQQYATYLWEIIYEYFDNLKEIRSYAPLLAYERKVESLRGRDGGNWLAARTATLRRSYLAYLGKPAKIAEAIQKHNDMRKHDNRKIRNAADLFQHLQDAFDTDLRRWIVDEGGYDVLGRKITAEGRQNYEKLIQQTIKSEVRISLLNRGFDVEVLREPQLLDEKRTDFLVRYGFAGPIVVEIKLTSNSDIKGKRIEGSPSYESMRRYMRGFGASHGLFVVFDNAGATNLPQITETFQKIEGVRVISFDCRMPVSKVKSSRKPVAKGKSRRPKNTS